MIMNAKDEFIEHIEDREVLCADIANKDYWEKGRTTFLLKQGYSEDDYSNFLNSLNFTYDSGYGGQELYGTIWYTDGTWSSRGEYDGSEWWEYNRVPDVPDELLQSNNK